jgi:hypothetical protein
MKPSAKNPNKSPVGYSVEGVIGLAGGHGAVARKCEVTPQSVAKWRYIPMKHARTVAIMAGLPIGIVRPDMVREIERSFA